MNATTKLCAALVLGLVLGGCGDSGSGEGATSRPSTPEWIEPEPDHPALKDPSKATETAPDKFVVRFVIATKNDAGDEVETGSFLVEATRSWAPLGTDRFYNLVKIGYFDGCRFFRVIPNYIAQFGIHGDPEVSPSWMNAAIKDDRRQQTNARGTLVFATGGKDTRTTQLFINLRRNQNLDGMGFAPFARVIQGMDVVDKLYGGYGDGPSMQNPRATGPNQGRIQREGNRYLEASYPKLHYVKSARLRAE